MQKTTCLLLTLAITALGSLCAKDVSVLTIGNSFANNALRYLEEIVDSTDHTVKVGRANLGGCSLQRHWEIVERYEADPEDPKGKPYMNKHSLKDMLTQQPWQYVTVQQVSTRSYLPETFEPEGSLLIEYVQENAPQAEVLLHQTWAYRADDRLFREGEVTQDTMYQRLSENYENLSQKHEGLRVLPSGKAFQLARKDPRWNFRIEPTDFDPQALEYPELPQQSQSLNVGYKWIHVKKDDRWILRNDGHHANDAGCYLAGLVWYGTLFDEDPRMVTFKPDSISEEDAVLLREFAARALENPGTLVLPPAN